MIANEQTGRVTSFSNSYHEGRGSFTLLVRTRTEDISCHVSGLARDRVSTSADSHIKLTFDTPVTPPGRLALE